MWYAFDESGLIFKDNSIGFKSKKETLNYLMYLNLEIRQNPLVKKISNGCYEYYPKSSEDEEESIFGIVIIHKKKIKTFGYYWIYEEIINLKNK